MCRYRPVGGRCQFADHRHRAATITSTYAYDALDRRTSASNGTDTLTFEYDTLNRPTAVKRAGVTISGATYNPDGTLATSIQPAGTASFTYDGMLRLASAAMPALFSGSATFTWRPDGLLGARAWPAGTNETFTYDAAKRPSQLLVRTSTNTTLATISTTFDRVGNLTTEAQVIPGVASMAGNSTLTFTNDPLRRTTGYVSAIPNATPTAGSDGGLDPGVAHTWTVDAIDASGNRGPKSSGAPPRPRPSRRGPRRSPCDRPRTSARPDSARSARSPSGTRSMRPPPTATPRTSVAPRRVAPT